MSDNPQLPEDSSHHLINPKGYAHTSIMEDVSIALCGVKSSQGLVISVGMTSELPACPTCSIKTGKAPR